MGMVLALDWTTTSSVVTAHADMEVWVTITQDSLGTTTYTTDTDHIYHTDRAICTTTSLAIKAWACPLPPFHKFCPHSDQNLYFKRRILNGQRGTGGIINIRSNQFLWNFNLTRVIREKTLHDLVRMIHSLNTCFTAHLGCIIIKQETFTPSQKFHVHWPPCIEIVLR